MDYNMPDTYETEGEVRKAFDNAERYIADVKHAWMYMYTQNGRDFFKNKNYRNYESVPAARPGRNS